MAGGEAGDVARGGEGDEAREARALRAGMQQRGEAALALVERPDARGVDEHRALGDEEPAAARDGFGARRERERDVEHRRARRLLEHGRRDPDLETGPHRPRPREPLAHLHAALHGFARGGQDLGARARSGRHDERPPRELGLGAQRGLQRQVRDQQTGHPSSFRRRSGPTNDLRCRGGRSGRPGGRGRHGRGWIEGGRGDRGRGRWSPARPRG